MISRFYAKAPLIAIFGTVALLVYYSPDIRTFFDAFASTVRSAYLRTTEGLHDAYEKHLRQVETITRLERRVMELEKSLVRCRSDAASFHALKEALGVRPEGNLTVAAARSLGYAKLGNFQQLWLQEFAGFDPAKNYGVVRNGYAVGIVVEQRNRPLMILAGDKECNFAVYIGEERAPGIATGQDPRKMVVKYIPEWMKIKRGDEVFTSGLDRLFAPGIPVGRVLSIRNMQGFKNAEIALYGDTLHPDFVWVVRR